MSVGGSLVRALAALIVVTAPVLGQDVEDSGREVTASAPPAHLQKSALFDFFRQRRLRSLPATVEGWLRELVLADYAPVRQFVPRGRSLQATSTDETNPRIVFASGAANKIGERPPLGFEDYTRFPGPDYEGRLFFGFAKRQKKMEILSWNRGAGRFDYYVASPIGPGETPKLYEVATRETCTACHQSEASIYPPQPWSEAVNHDPQRPPPGARLRSFAAEPALFAKDGVLLTREATPFANNSGLGIGLSSFTANRLLQATRIFKDACGSDRPCRRALVFAALANPTQSDFLRKTVFRGAQPLDFDFNLATTNLTAKFGGARTPAFLTAIAATVRGNWRRDNYAYVNEFIPDMTFVTAGNVPPAAADPRTPRDSVRGIDPALGPALIADAAFDVLGFTRSDAVRISQMPAVRLQAILTGDSTVREVTERLDTLLESWPPDPEAVLSAIGAPAAAPVPPAPAPAAPIRPAPALFAHYCAGCHRRGGEGPLVPFEDMTAMRRFELDRGNEIRDRLTRRTMPPASRPARTIPQPTDPERNAMIRFLGGTLAAATGPVVTTHLGVRARTVDGLRRSYLVPDTALSIVEEATTEACGTTKVEVEAEDPSAQLPMGRGNDGRWYPALEIFPHWLPGNLMQLDLVTDGDACHPLAVTRAGKLVRLGWNRRRGAFGTVPVLPSRTSARVAVQAILVSEKSFALGVDGALYRLIYPGTGPDDYSLTAITPSGLTGTRTWNRIGWRAGPEGLTIVAQSTVGTLVSFSLGESADATTLTRLQEVPVGGPERTVRWAVNLSDPSALMLLPGASAETP